MSDISVGDARPEDFSAVDVLAVDVYVGDGFLPAAEADGLRGSATRVDAAQVLVARGMDGRIVGTVTLVIDDGPARRMSHAGEAEIRLLAVSRDVRGGGAGSTLVRECLSRARAAGRARCVLCTQVSMIAAHRIYERAGLVRDPSRDFVTDAGTPMLAYTIEL
jgi:ribosomal protein S18 acetylase RimI-like enzyme